MEFTDSTVDNKNSFMLYDFAYLGDERKLIEILKNLAMPEDWDWQPFDNSNNPDNPNNSNNDRQEKNAILFKYMHYTFNRIKEEYDAADTDAERQKRISTSEQYACFNTGLFTPNYSPIFMAFAKNRNDGRQPWYFKSFFFGSVPRELLELSLPERANYFTNPADLIYDYHFPIRVDVDHIFKDENYSRFPEYIREKYSPNTLRNLFNGAVIEAERKLAGNYKIAIPQYYNRAIQLLVPIDLENKGGGHADLALAMFKAKDCYSARTCLTLEMAYNNARLIVKPESSWLHPHGN